MTMVTYMYYSLPPNPTHRYDFVKDVTTAFREEALASLLPLRDTHATITMKQQMTSQVQEVTRKYQDVELSPKELADTFVAVPPPTSLEELCRKSCVAKVDGPGLQSVTTKLVAKFTVHTLDTHGQPSPAQQHVSAELKSLVDGSVPQTRVVTQTPFTYELSYTPTTRGRHQLTVRVNNTEIGTFQVFLHHPTLLGTPVRVTDGMNQPLYMAISDTELFVTETYRYTVLNMQGQRVLTIGSKGKPPFGNGNPIGIATDGDGSVFIASSNRKLWKFSRRGELVKSIGKIGQPMGVRYHNHQVYVCDYANAGVQVFDSNLNFLRTFGTRGDGPGRLKDPWDLDFDTEGNIYVVDAVKHQVLVFSEDGQYLRHFGRKGKGKGELNSPRGLCVSRDCVYVAEWRNDRISVFHTSGQFVHSFGKYGTGRGELFNPYGVATDKDGFVFVCDYFNNRIQVF